MNKKMNGRLCVVLSLAAVLSACAAERCQESSAITINLMNPDIEVNPANRCAVPGEAIPMNIRPPRQEPGTVRTSAKSGVRGAASAKSGTENWLNGTNEQFANLIILEVPDRAYFDTHCPGPSGTVCEYAYRVEAPDKAPLDPMITVRK